MPRPCCPARKQFPELHRLLLATEPQHLHWFAYLTKRTAGTVGVDDAAVVARVGYKHDPDNDQGLSYLTAFLADYLDGAKARGVKLPTKAHDWDPIAAMGEAAIARLSRRLGREPSSAEVVAEMAGDWKFT